MHPELYYRKLHRVDVVEESTPRLTLNTSLSLNKHKVNYKPPLSQSLVGKNTTMANFVI